MKGFINFLGRNRSGMLKVLLVLVGIVVFGEVWGQTNYYIAPTAGAPSGWNNGSNSNTGTSQSSPYATLAYLFSQRDLGTGDIIYIAAGTYTEKAITVGSNDEGFTIQGAALSSGMPTSIFDSDQTDGWLYLGDANNDNITINNIYVKDYMETSNASNYGGSGLRIIDGCTGLTITSTFFDNCDAPGSARGGAIHVLASTTATTMTLTDVSFFNCLAPAQGGAFLIEASSDYDVNMTRCKFYSNTSSTNSGSAIYYSGAAGSILTMTNCLVYANTLSSSNHGTIYIHTNADANLLNCTVANNTAQASYTGGIYFAAGGSTLKNCIMYGNTYRDITRVAGTINVDYCCYQNESNCTITNSITSDPLLTSNYKLRSGSPCINAGTSSGAPTDDLASITRTGNPDIGCYERICSGATSYSGPYDVGATGQWTNLTAAIGDLQSCMSATVTLNLQSTYDNTLETYPIRIENLPTSSTTYYLQIQPKTGANGISITSSSSTGTVLFNNADYVYFNGSPNGGSSLDTTTNLLINNTGGGYTFRFENDATYNRVKYCKVKGQNVSSSSGTFVFGAASTNGNDNNSISYNKIFSGTTTSTNAIYSLGATASNNNDTIDNNFICDYFSASNASNGVLLSDFNTNWIITNNRFYQTSSRTQTTSTQHSAINITYTSSSGNGFTISGNTIGYGASNGTGTYTFVGNSSAGSRFIPIYLKVGSTTTTVESNIINNIAISVATNSVNKALPGTFAGIAVLEGSVTIGSSGKGNIIGSRSTPGTSITYVSGTSGNYWYGIYTNTASTVNIDYNTIAGLGTTSTSGNTIGYIFSAIYTRGSGSVNVRYNSIGSSTANSLIVGKSGMGDPTSDPEFYGIDNETTGIVTITNDTIQNITLYGTGASLFYGIDNSSLTAANSSISNNTISTISIPQGGTSGIFNGIYNTSLTTLSISNNTIKTISLANGLFQGINDAPSTTQTGTHTISSNTIGGTGSDDIQITSTNSGSSNSYWNSQVRDYGISVSGSTTTNLTSNVIQNITVNASKSYYAFVGIQIAGGGTYNVSTSQIYYITKKSTNGSESYLIGMYLYGNNSTCNIIKNKINFFKSESTSGYLIGAAIKDVTASNFTNNLFILDNRSYTSGGYPDVAIVMLYNINGRPVNAYYNSFKISGTNSGSRSSGFFTYHNNWNGVSQTLTFYNNILLNERSGGTGNYYITNYGSYCPTTTNFNYNYYYNSSSSTFGYEGANTYTSSTYINATAKGKGGLNSFSASSSPIVINSDGSLSSSDMTTVGRGMDLSNSSTYPNCQDDINYVVGERAGGSGTANAGKGVKGCYEAVCLVVSSPLVTPANICQNNTYSPSINVTNQANASVTISYQLQFSSDNSSFSNVANGTPANSNYANATGTSASVGAGAILSALSSNVTGNISAGSSYYYRYTLTTSTGCMINSSQSQLIISSSVTPSVVISSDDGDNIFCSGTNVTFTATPSNGGASPSYQWKLNGSNVGSNTTTYVNSTLSNNDIVAVVMTANNSCQTASTANSSDITNTVNALPNVSTTISETSGTTNDDGIICSGATITLSGTGASTYSWDNSVTNNVAFTATSTTTYTVTGTDANGCTNTATRTITVNDLPTLTSIGTITAVNYNASAQTSSLTYTASTNSPTSYSIDWSSGITDQGLTNHNFSGGSSISNIAISAGVAAGSYSGTMTFTTDAGCSGTQAVTIVINSGTTTFYYVGSGSMATLSNWGSNSDGTGTNPASMTATNHTYYITHNNTTSPTSNVSWSLDPSSKIIVGNGTNATNFTIDSGFPISGTIDVANNATLTIAATTNPTLGTLDAGSTIVYAGSSAQTLPANDTIPKLTINNSNGVSLGGNATVSGTLTLTAGKLTIPSSTTLTLGTTSTDITLNTGGATNYIVCTDTTSKIQRYLNANSTTYTFPMGDASSYNPMTLNFTSGATGGSKYVTTSVKNTVAPGFVMANFSNYIKRYWLIYGSTNFTGVNYTITYKYNNSDVQVLNTEHTLIPVKRSGATWYKPSEAVNITNGTVQGSGTIDTTNNICTWSGLTSFSFDMAAGDEASALPIHLLYFTAKPQTNRVRLDWATASETNNDYFTVERSQDGEHFNELFKKPGAGISTTNLYYFGYDNKPYDGISYYRLKQTDYDGKYEYSDVESVNFTQGNAKEDIELSIYPNPVENGTFHVKFDAKQQADFHVAIYDAVGKLIYQETINAEKGPNDHAIELPSVAAGMYQLVIRNDELGVITRSIEF